MPIYEYEHTEDCCALGRVFEVRQSIKDDPLSRCPECSAPVRKLLSLTNIATPRTNSELRDLGFTKLVRRDDGVYENVTARHGENRVMERGKPDTVPDFTKTIRD